MGLAFSHLRQRVHHSSPRFAKTIEILFLGPDTILSWTFRGTLASHILYSGQRHFNRAATEKSAKITASYRYFNCEMHKDVRHPVRLSTREKQGET
jgi:hypothetical protein